MWKSQLYFDFEKIVSRIVSIVEQRLKSGQRPVELEIVQRIISEINTEINTCNSELELFELNLSLEARNIFHLIAIKKIYEFYIQNI